MKKILSVLLMVLLVLSCAACSMPEEETSAPDNTPSDTPAPSGNASNGAFDEYTRPVVKEKLKVGYMIRTPDAESHIRSFRQAEIECAHRGWELVDAFYEADTNFREYFLNLLNQGVDAIIVGSVDTYETKQELVDQARNAGVGVYSNDTQVIPGVISNCTMPNGVAAMELFFKVGEDYNWNLNVCTTTYNAIQSDRMRMYPIRSALNGIWPNVKELATEELSSVEISSAQAAYEYTQTWIQQFGEEVNCFMSGADYWGIPMAEAIMQAGDEHGDKWFTVGFDGGAQAWSYIRKETPLRYSYAQPFEYFTHNVFEIIDQIQVKGLNPGDPGCMISHVGETVYSTGAVVTRANCPAIGSNVHAFFNYYDPNNTDAWYNWTDGPGIYEIVDYTE